MARKAIAATLASVVLMTVLVVADATVMAAQDNLASSAQTTQTESLELLMERSLAGSVSIQALAQVQAYLTSTPAGCDDLPQYLGAISASASVKGEDSGVEYMANATARDAPTATRADNLTLVAPFSGGGSNVLDLVESLSITEVGGGGSVDLHRHESHTINVPISPGSASALCASSLAAIGSALSRSPCNATIEQSSFGSVLPGLVAAAAAQGFDLTAGWGPAGAACSAAYWITLVELGVSGAAGSFDWTVRGSGMTA